MNPFTSLTWVSMKAAGISWVSIPSYAREERTTRQEKIAAFEAFLIAKNKELAEATRSRDSEKTRQPIFKELRRLKIKNTLLILS